MKQFPSHFVAYIGLDWSDRKHDICLIASDSDKFEYDVINHSPESIEEWALALQKRFNNQPIAICLELKAGPVVYALLKYNFIVLFPIPPKALCKPKAVMSPFNKAKMSPLSIRGARDNDHDEPSRDRQAGGYSTS
jgi:hypothetical protein